MAAPGAKRQRNLERVSEYQEQCAVIDWWDWWAPTKGYDVRLLFAVPNGAYLGRDPKQRMITMKALKRAGLRPGALDLVLAIPRPPFCGLFPEMKALDGREGADQIEYVDLLRSQGYRAEFCYGADDAIETIKGYLG